MKIKNKYGFTLIELLAVIVVLAIIALIATPIVMNTIKNAKKGAAERSADNYIKQVETAVATSRLDNEGVQDGTYTINNEGNLEGNGLKNPLIIEMSGNKPTGGTITIRNGQVTTDSKMTIGSYEVSYNPTNKKYEATEKDSSSSTNVLCKAVTTATTGNIPNYGDEYICNLGDTDDSKNLTFFVLDKTDTEVSLIMNKNLGAEVNWCTKEDYIKAGGTDSDYGTYGASDKGPLTALSILKDRTASWKYLNSSQVTMPSGEQIAKASGVSSWSEDSTPGDGVSTWLGGDAYWTSSPFRKTSAWIVIEYPNNDPIIPVLYESGTINTTCGLRPVITISKSQLG